MDFLNVGWENSHETWERLESEKGTKHLQITNNQFCWRVRFHPLVFGFRLRKFIPKKVQKYPRRNAKTRILLGGPPEASVLSLGRRSALVWELKQPGKRWMDYGGPDLKHGGHSMVILWPQFWMVITVYISAAFFSKNQVFWGKMLLLGGGLFHPYSFLEFHPSKSREDDSHFEEHIFSIETKTKLDHGLVKCCLVGIYPPPTHR